MIFSVENLLSKNQLLPVEFSRSKKLKAKCYPKKYSSNIFMRE